MSAALWWLCDRSWRGLILGTSTALLAALVAQFVVENGFFMWVEYQNVHPVELDYNETTWARRIRLGQAGAHVGDVYG